MFEEPFECSFLNCTDLHSYSSLMFGFSTTLRSMIVDLSLLLKSLANLDASLSFLSEIRSLILDSNREMASYFDLM